MLSAFALTVEGWGSPVDFGFGYVPAVYGFFVEESFPKQPCTPSGGSCCSTIFIAMIIITGAITIAITINLL